jgi:hypothetical protein
VRQHRSRLTSAAAARLGDHLDPLRPATQVTTSAPYRSVALYRRMTVHTKPSAYGPPSPQDGLGTPLLCAGGYRISAFRPGLVPV